MLLLVHLALTWFMTGVIWIVQVVHYPLFARVGSSTYSDYQRRHMRQITFVVLPAMGLEVLSGAVLLFENPGNIWFTLNTLGLAVIWLSTLLLQVPQHQKLVQGFSASRHQKLVRSNWIRTIVWSLRSVGLLILVADFT